MLNKTFVELGGNRHPVWKDMTTGEHFWYCVDCYKLSSEVPAHITVWDHTGEFNGLVHDGECAKRMSEWALRLKRQNDTHCFYYVEFMFDEDTLEVELDILQEVHGLTRDEAYLYMGDYEPSYLIADGCVTAASNIHNIADEVWWTTTSEEAEKAARAAGLDTGQYVIGTSTVECVNCRNGLADRFATIWDGDDEWRGPVCDHCGEIIAATQLLTLEVVA